MSDIKPGDIVLVPATVLGVTPATAGRNEEPMVWVDIEPDGAWPLSDCTKVETDAGGVS